MTASSCIASAECRTAANSDRIVLVVDDDALVLMSISRAIERLGYEVLQATSGEQAVAICAERVPDVVLLDIRMHGISGIEAATQIRECGEIPIIFLSAYSDDAIVRQATDGGAFGYLVKPIQLEQLGPSIEAAIARAAELKALKEREMGLQLALAGDCAINIAVGILMAHGKLSSADAFEALRRSARNGQRKLADVASELVKSSDVVNQVVRVAGELGARHRK